MFPLNKIFYQQGTAKGRASGCSRGAKCYALVCVGLCILLLRWNFSLLATTLNDFSTRKQDHKRVAYVRALYVTKPQQLCLSSSALAGNQRDPRTCLDYQPILNGRLLFSRLSLPRSWNRPGVVKMKSPARSWALQNARMAAGRNARPWQASLAVEHFWVEFIGLMNFQRHRAPALLPVMKESK